MESSVLEPHPTVLGRHPSNGGSKCALYGQTGDVRYKREIDRQGARQLELVADDVTVVNPALGIPARRQTVQCPLRRSKRNVAP